jgi:iron complex transport system substrate-binding protein
VRNSRLLSLAVAATTVLALAACSSGAAGSNSGPDVPPAEEGAFPVTIEHAYGETTITEQPLRVATVAWANHEVPLALGIVPVIQEKVTWGDDDGDGILPWVTEKLDELGAEPPALYDPTDGIDFEAISDAAPDVILAAYSGLTEEEYETLSKIAPTIAFPDVAWATSLEDVITMNSAALGFPAAGAELIDQMQSDVADALAAYPALEGKKVLFSYIDPADLSQIGFYTTYDTRPNFLESIGFPLPEIVAEESAKSETFYVTVSAEEADRFSDVDVFVTYGDDPEAFIAQLQADPLLSQIPAIAEGRIAVLQNSTPLAASANPSALSIGWGLDDYFAILAGPLAAQAG